MKRLSRWIPLLLAAVMLLLLVSGCGPKKEAGVVDVQAKGLTFTPSTVTISAGTTVRWTNGDDTPHQPSSEGFTPGGPNPSGAWSLKPIDPGKSGSRKFDQKGTFKYQCLIHPYMHGTVIVK